MNRNCVCCLILALAVALLSSCAQRKTESSTTAGASYDGKEMKGGDSTTSGTTGPRGRN